MILSGPEIARRVRSGEIIIEPYAEAQLNPNSYNYRLGTQIACIEPDVSLGDYDREPNLEDIPSEGFLLQPRRLYLATTLESIGSKVFVTSLIGRSSIGRLGLFVQLTADLGHLGDAHCWTLELTCVQPIRVYSAMLLGQISFWRPFGELELYDGPYSRHSVPKGILRRLLAGEGS